MSRPRPQALAAISFACLVTPCVALGQTASKPTESAEDTHGADQAPVDRGKSLQVSVGLPPSALDLGSEADILGVRDSREMAAMLERWAFSMKGSIRAPMRVGFGPR